MKVVLENYTFNAAAKTITFNSFSVGQPLDLSRLYLIGDTTLGAILYTSVAPIATATLSSGSVVTLSALPAGAANGDALQIIYELLPTDPGYNFPVTNTTDKEFTNVVATVTAAGSTTLYTPASGNQVRLHWSYAMNNPASGSPPLIKVSLGANEYYRVYALSKQQQITGPINGALSVNLSGSGNVACTFILEEITP